MKPIEFNAIVKNSTIEIPLTIKRKLKNSSKRRARVIILIEEEDINEEKKFKAFAAKEFLKGYAESDSVYDKYPTK